jgi:hypothetical protein
MAGQREFAVAYAIPVAALLLLAPAVAAPLAVYTITLAVFGLPHVLSELRYVDRRFGRHLAPALLVRLGALLALIVAARTATVFQLLPAQIDVVFELSLVVLLALSVAVGGWPQKVAAVAVALAIGAATFASPYETTVVFAILHNFTPLGFLWQLLPAGRRGPALTAATLGLVGVPLFVASGLPFDVLAAHGILSDADPMGAGSLGAHLHVYVPRAWLATRAAVDLFSASVVAQCLHYLSVIVVLPVMLARIEPGASGLVPWPRAGWFYAAIAAVGAATFVRFAGGFADARAYYGIAASFHAWVEIPILILALTGSVQPKKENSPTAQDAVLATSETSIAR